MSVDSILYVAMGLLIALILFVVVMALFRWHQEKLRRQQALYEQLKRRCERITELLQSIPDRYLPLETKTWLVQYVIDTIATLPEEFQSSDLRKAFIDFSQLLPELKQGQQATLKDRISNEEQLERVDQALKALPSLLKAMVSHGVADKAAARFQTELIRFRFALARHDILVKRAQDSLDHDKRARALEYYREAQIEIEKVSTLTEAEPVLLGLQNTIKQLESQLFKRKNDDSE